MYDFRCWQSVSISMYRTSSRSTITCHQHSVIIVAHSYMVCLDRDSNVKVIITLAKVHGTVGSTSDCRPRDNKFESYLSHLTLMEIDHEIINFTRDWSLARLNNAHGELLYYPRRWAGLGGSVGCAVWLETRRSRVQPPPRSATFFRGDWSWNIFYGHSLPSADSRRAVVSFWRKNVHSTG